MFGDQGRAIRAILIIYAKVIDHTVSEGVDRRARWATEVKSNMYVSNTLK
jgi:hypothetical protein